MNNDLISRSDIKDHISELLIFYIGEFTKCPKCLYDEASGADLANAILNAIDNAPTVYPICEDKACKYRAERPQASNNAELFKQTFGIYATELWSMKEADFLEWLNSEVENETDN